MRRPFRQVDVFSAEPFRGNPVAVVLDADGLSADEMQLIARWTNLSEATFVLPPTVTGADYRVRIFTPVTELPFAGHPTLGTCHAWLEAGNQPVRPDAFVQECGLGLIEIRRTADGLAFAAPPLINSAPVSQELLARIASQLRIDPADIVQARHADNGPGWVAVLLASADAVLAVRPGTIDLDIGIAGPYTPDSLAAWEVRAFFPKDGVTTEDPVTGSFNAALAQWLFESGRETGGYMVSQGTVLGRAGRVYITREDGGEIWVAGAAVTRISGFIDL